MQISNLEHYYLISILYIVYDIYLYTSIYELFGDNMNFRYIKFIRLQVLWNKELPNILEIKY